MSRTLLRLRLGLVDDLAHQRLPRLRRRQTRYALKLDDLLVEVGQPSAFRVQFGLATIERRLALLERGHLAIERLLPVEEAALGALEVGALLARLILGGAAQVDRLILALEDDLLLLARASATRRCEYCSACLIALLAMSWRAKNPSRSPTTAATVATTTTRGSGMRRPSTLEPSWA